jgi:hypothetical protein
MFKLDDHFETMDEVKTIIKAAILDAGQSFRVYKSDSTRYLLHCKAKGCPFNVWIIYSKRTELATVTKYDEHECSPAIHYSNHAASSVKYLKDYHQASVIDNNDITPCMYYILST